MLKWRLLLGGGMIVFLAVLLGVDLFCFETAGGGWMLEVVRAGLAPVMLVTVLACLAAAETLDFARRRGCRPHRALAVSAVAVVALQPLAASFWPQATPGRSALLVLTVILAWALQILRGRIERAGVDLAWTLLVVVYAGLLSSYASSIRVAYGPVHFIFLISAVKAADIGAYFGGLALGRSKLIGWLSPGKTWEGLGAALAAGAGIGAVVAYIARTYVPAAWSVSVGLSALIALLAAAMGHLGDLAESLLKREAGVKDSASVLPAFGGVLDLADSVLFAAPAVYLFFQLAGSYN